jgi:phosphate transport system substrate-binding protein
MTRAGPRLSSRRHRGVTKPLVTMARKRHALLCLLSTFSLAACDEAAGGAAARREIRVVGSSTVYPFATRAAELFLAAHPHARVPVIESTGTGAGIRLFCSGAGAAYPDMVDASRALRPSERARCRQNGVGALVEVPIGRDGIALAAARSAPQLPLTPELLFRALAAQPDGTPNRVRTWRDIHAALPPRPIIVYGPPSTSGTRDALVQLVLARGCEVADPRVVAWRDREPARYAARCLTLREDGAYRDAGENDNLIVQKLVADPDALGVLGYGYLAENAASIRGEPLNGVEPTPDAIANGRYPGARMLYVYVKEAHLRAIPGLGDYLATFAAAWGPDGPLARRGLIPLHRAERARAAAIVRGAAGAGMAPRT